MRGELAGPTPPGQGSRHRGEVSVPATRRLGATMDRSIAATSEHGIGRGAIAPCSRCLSRRLVETAACRPPSRRGPGRRVESCAADTARTPSRRRRRATTGRRPGRRGGGARTSHSPSVRSSFRSGDRMPLVGPQALGPGPPVAGRPAALARARPTPPLATHPARSASCHGSSTTHRGPAATWP